MKKILFYLTFIFTCTGLLAQNVQINPTGIIPLQSSGTTVAFKAILATNQFIPTSGAIFLPAIEEFDLSNNYNAGIFTAPSDGIYSFSVSVQWTPVGTGTILNMYLNSVSATNLIMVSNGIGGGAIIYQNHVFLKKLTTGQTLSIFLNHNIPSGGTNILGSQQSFFSGYKIN
jgi:hypothetical protein